MVIILNLIILIFLIDLIQFISKIGEELIIDCHTIEVNRAVERYSIRKLATETHIEDNTNNELDDEQFILNTLPEASTPLSHMNSSQTTNLVNTSLLSLTKIFQFIYFLFIYL